MMTTHCQQMMVCIQSAAAMVEDAEREWRDTTLDVGRRMEAYSRLHHNLGMIEAFVRQAREYVVRCNRA
jgi:hypothetical protein